MSIRFTPHEAIPSVEQRGDDTWFCSMCRSSFDRDAFDSVGGACPGCEHMDEVNERVRGAL